MGKIRVTDLATMMGVSHQDLVFKLRSIGVRVEGEEAAVESEILQAILAGKKLASPREVIMDDSSPEGAPAAARRAGASAPAGACGPSHDGPAAVASDAAAHADPEGRAEDQDPAGELRRTSSSLAAPAAASDPMLAAFAAAETRRRHRSAGRRGSHAARRDQAGRPRRPAAAAGRRPLQGRRRGSAARVTALRPPATATPQPASATPAPGPAPPVRPARGAVLVHRATEAYRPTPPPARPGYRPSGPGTRPGGPPGSRPSGPPGARPAASGRPAPGGATALHRWRGNAPPMGGPSRPGARVRLRRCHPRRRRLEAR